MDTANLTHLWQTVKAEDAKREEIKQSPDYQSLQSIIEGAQDKQEAMLAAVPSHSADFAAEKRRVIEYMLAEGIERLGNVSAVIRQRKEVNIARLLRVLEGDIDNFCVLAKVQQNTLKDFAKTDARKSDLLDCIEQTGQEIVDVEILPA